MKQYNPLNPIKRGYKLWCVADQRCYVLKFELYQGKDEATQVEFKDFSLGERVVLSLTKFFWGQQRICFFDNYFNSLRLLDRLKTEKVLAAGTIRRDRKGLPPDNYVD